MMAMSSSRTPRVKAGVKWQAEPEGHSQAAPPAKKQKLPQPNNQSPMEDWVEWYQLNPHATPSSIWHNEQGHPHFGDVEALYLIRWLAPHSSGGRHAWGIAVGQLFSIPGLYALIV